jgi:hypothetical protein
MSLLALYGWGGWLVSAGLMPLRVMISGIGFTFSLLYATQVSVFVCVCMFVCVFICVCMFVCVCV